MRAASRGPDRIIARGARAAPGDTPAAGAEVVRPLRRARSTCDAPERVVAKAWALGGGLGCAWRLSLPGRRSGCGAKRVVTGAKIGLRASGGKEIANRKLRVALVTGWYGAATTELPPAAWSADADVGAERRNQVPYRDPSRCRAGRRPAPGTTGHSEPEAGSLKPNGEAAAVRDLSDLCGDRGTPRVLMMPPSRGAWRCKRGRGHSLAVRTKRNAGKRGAPKPCSRPLSDDRHAAAAAWVGSVRRHRAFSQHCCGSARLAQRGSGSPISTQLPHARPGAA